MSGRPIILDGYNLMFRDGTPEDASLADAREAFLVHVEAVRKATDEVVVVFDGVIGGSGRGPRSGGSSRSGGSGPAPAGIRIVWSRAPRSADDMIVRLVERYPRRQATVLTWDRELRHRVKSAGAVVGDPSAYLTPPKKKRSAPSSGRSLGKPRAPRGAELDEWERLFRDSDDDDPPSAK